MTVKVLKFEASWCQPCKQLTALLHEMGREVEVVDVDDAPELTAEFKVRSVPTMVMVDEAGNEVSRLVGVKPAAELARWFNQ